MLAHFQNWIRLRGVACPAVFIFNENGSLAAVTLPFYEVKLWVAWPVRAWVSGGDCQILQIAQRDSPPDDAEFAV